MMGVSWCPVQQLSCSRCILFLEHKHITYLYCPNLVKIRNRPDANTATLFAGQMHSRDSISMYVCETSMHYTFLLHRDAGALCKKPTCDALPWHIS